MLFSLILRVLFLSAIFFTAPQSVFADANESVDEVGGAADMQYPHYASPKLIPPREFARDPGISSASLSPDGKHFLTVSPAIDNVQIRVFSTENGDAEKHFFDNVPRRMFAGAYWASNDRIVLETETWKLDRNWRWYRHNMLIAVDRSGENMERLHVSHMTKSLWAVDELIVSMLPDDSDNILIMTEGKKKNDPALSKLDIYTGETELVMSGREGISGWMVDHDGNPRLGIGYDDDRLKLIARTVATSDWVDLHENETFESGRFSPLAFDFDGNSMFVRSAVANGRFAIYRFDLTTGKLSEKIFEHAEVDARGIEVSNSRKKLLAVTFTRDRLERQFFDDDHKRLMLSIDKALPGRSNHILDNTDDDRYYLLYSVSDRYPGALYRLDTKDKLRMEVLSEMNRKINPQLMSPTSRIDYFARDGLEIPAYLTVPKNVDAKKMPLIVLPHGGPAARSGIDYDNIVQFLASRGYLVMQPNFRGSTGYSYEYQSMGHGEWGAAMQTDLEDAVDYLVDEDLVDSDRVCIMGQGGYSSYAALLGVMKSPDRFKCAVAIAPITDLAKRIKDVRSNSGKNAAKLISGNRKSKALNAVSPIKLVKKLDRPLLMFHGAKDRHVPLKEFEKFEKALKKAGKSFETIKSEDDAHGLNTPKSRTKFLRKLEKFLIQHIGEGIVMPTDETVAATPRPSDAIIPGEVE